MRQSGLSHEDLICRVREIGIELHPTARRIPRNSLRLFRRMFDESALPPATAPSTSADTGSEEGLPAPPLEWRTVGREREMRYLSEEDILIIHRELEKEFKASNDPISPPGIKDRAQVSMSAQRPHTSLEGILKYPTVEMAAAALFHSVVQNHGFYNGNKRTALVALVVFLDRNGMAPTCQHDDLYRFTLRVAKHGIISGMTHDIFDREVLAIADWVQSNCRSTSKEERSMKWHKLKAVLSRHGCRFQKLSGNRLNIYRSTKSRSGRISKKLGRSPLRTQVSSAGEGAEVDQGTIHKIRADLRLDYENGMDSKAFYGDAEPNEIIQEYDYILKKLGRF